MITYRALKPDSHGVQADPVKEVELKMFLMTPTTRVIPLGFPLMLGLKREKELPEKIQQDSTRPTEVTHLAEETSVQLTMVAFCLQPEQLSSINHSGSESIQ